MSEGVLQAQDPLKYGKGSISQDQHHLWCDRLRLFVMLRVMQFESHWAGHQAVRLPAPCPPPATGRFSLCQGAPPRSIDPVLPLQGS